MLTQKQIDIIVKEKFIDMQASINAIETQILEAGDEMNKQLISFHVGKIFNDYKIITSFLGTFKEELDKE